MIADLGTLRLDHPLVTASSSRRRCSSAFQPYKGGFLSHGHHNRVYRVGLDGAITVQIAFGNTVPTGLDVDGQGST